MLNPISLRALDATGANDGDVPTYDAAAKQYKPAAVPSGGGSGSVPAGGSTGQVLTKLSATDYDADWETPSAGGGGPGKDPRWNVPAGVTSIDEFNDGALDPTWVRVDGTGAPAGNVTWTERGDALGVLHLPGDTMNYMHALLRPIGTAVAVGDAFITALRLMTSTQNYPAVMLALSDSTVLGSGTQVLSFATADATMNDQQAYSRAWAGWNTSGGAGIGAIRSPRGALTYLRLVCTATNTWRTDISPDGNVWLKGTATLAATITPTHMGFATVSFGAPNPFAASFEFLRRVSGVS